MSYRTLFNFSSVVVLLLFVTSLLWRIPNLSTPFWVDEFSSARQASLFVQHGVTVFSSGEYIEHHNIPTHILIAVSFVLFGESEQSARLPFVLIGSLVPIAVYLLGKTVFSHTVALASSVLTVFSYIEITWSRQARGYVISQLVWILLLYCFWQWIDNDGARVTSRWFLLCVLLGTLGLLTHSMFLLALAGMAIWSVIFLRAKIRTILMHPLVWLTAGVLGVLSVWLGFWSRLLETVQSGLLGFSINLGYYHAFLWREYGVITVLAMLGIVLGWKHYRSVYALFICCSICILCFVSFVFQSLDTRYILLFFPWMFFFWVSIGLERISSQLTSQVGMRRIVVAVGILFLLVNGHKFALKPKAFYSVNHDFREIALVDYDALYRYIVDHGGADSDTVIIETWADRLLWYLPNIADRGALFRWKSGGTMKNTNTYHDDLGVEREVSSRVRFVGDRLALDALMRQYPKGFIWIDDTSLPRDVVDYVEKNLHKEFAVDRYALDDNPYSVWPGTLYSWGRVPSL